MKHGKIIILSGPSGSGKTTLYKKLLTGPDTQGILVKSISVTTRPRRPTEKNGRDYFFVTLAPFLRKRKAGHFLEYERVFNNYYGTPVKGVEGLLKDGKNVLLCIDVKGAKTVKKRFPKAATIFVKTPSIRVLKERLARRGSENSHQLALRLKRAKAELREAKNYDHVVINSQLHHAYRKLKRLVLKELECQGKPL